LIKQILVPLDGSHAAEAVLPYVERIAAATNSSVLLLAAVDRARDWGEDTGGDLKGERHEAESYLRRLQARLTSSTGRDVELEVIESEPAAGILAKSEKHQPGLIAMTTHGRSGLARWVLGSVAAKLLHATHTPILVVRPPHDAEQTVPSLTKILVPLDGSALSASVLPFGGDLAKSLGASIVLFHAVAEPVLTYPETGAISFDARVLEEMEKGARSFLTSTAKDLAADGLQTNVVANFGNASDGIVWTAERENAQLVVMSTHGRSGIGRVVLGSVADAVVRRTSLPVILVRPTTNSGRADG